MKKNYNLFRLREAIRELSVELEPDFDEDEVSNKVRYPVGYIKYEVPSGGFKELPMVVIEDADERAYCVGAANGSVYIVLSIDLLGSDILLPIVAHEIGHYESGHFTTKEDDLGSVDLVNVKQKSLIKLYSEAESKSEERLIKAYLNTTIIGLLRGGVLKDELEADTYALNYCSIKELFKVHSDKTKDPNFSIRLEIQNRFSRLLLLEDKPRLCLEVNDYELSDSIEPTDYFNSLAYKLRFKGELDTPSKVKEISELLDIDDLDKMISMHIEMPEEVKNKLTHHFKLGEQNDCNV